MKYASQFRGKMPQEHVEPEKIPSNRKEESPSKMRKRDSIQIGSASQARPGLSALRSPKHKFKRSARGR